MNLYHSRLSLNLLIIGLWLWLYRPVYDYLAVIFSREDFRTNQVILLGVIGLIAFQVRQGKLRPRLDRGPHLFLPALGLALGGSLLYLAVERFLDINTFSASLFGLASYGLLGLWLEPQRWRWGLPAALLLVGTLPFGEHIQTFIGYPMRILTAAIVHDGLAAAGVAAIGVDTILVFENGISQVDLPCSGVKSLWTGLLFLVAATWLERRPLNLRWLLVAFVFAALLFIANLSRVAVLVTVGQVAGWPLAAELLHVPLGVLGFAAVCAAAVAILHWQQPQSDVEAVGLLGKWGELSRLSEQPGKAVPQIWDRPIGDLAGEGGVLAGDRLKSRLPLLARPLWLGPILAAAILGMALSYSPRPWTGLAQPPPAWLFSNELATKPAPLKPDEVEWLVREGAESAERRDFAWRDVTGSMILITSATWRAHHRPERCFEVYGLAVNSSRTHLVEPGFPVRLVSLGEGDKQLMAVYWFQATDRTTDDYGSRIWADLAPGRRRWVLVSILFYEPLDPQAVEMQPFYTDLHEAVARSLRGN